MSNQGLKEIAQHTGFQIIKTKPLHGGDINQVHYCNTSIGELVIKLNDRDRFPALFSKEANGLDELRKSGSFVIPEVISYGEIDETAYLILQYFAPSPVKDWSAFGVQLAELHRMTSPQFGLDEWNYIGSLHQPNAWESTPLNFFIRQRLAPQFRLAAENGFDFNNQEKLYKAAEQLIPDEGPALIHGDLWGGNYLHTTDGFALIDPAVSYGLREMDLAMMQLFGGFPSEVFRAYEAAFPTAPNLSDRIPLYQLYYILVHVNLFGSAYVGRAEAIIRRYV
jgi:fructosamine-3-kinase